MKSKAISIKKLEAIIFWRIYFTVILFSAIGLIPLKSVGQTLNLIAGGDVAWPIQLDIPVFDRNLKFYGSQDSAEIKAKPDLAVVLGPMLSTADLAFVNLEHPITSRAQLQPLPWAPTFRAHPSLATQLKQAGIDLVSTANNHALDAGLSGIDETLTHLEDAHIIAAGTGKTIKQARQPAVVERNGLRIALLAYTQPENSLIGHATPTRPGAAPLELSYILADINAVQPAVDLVLVSLHWGKTGSNQPTETMRSLARQIIDAGADAILGHHSHVPHGIELYQGKPIVYSLGNLIFPYARPSWGDNMLVQFTFDRDQLQRLKILPIDGGNPAQPKILTGDRAQIFLKTLQTQSANLGAVLEIKDNYGEIVVPPVQQTKIE